MCWYIERIIMVKTKAIFDQACRDSLQTYKWKLETEGILTKIKERTSLKFSGIGCRWLQRVKNGHNTDVVQREHWDLMGSITWSFFKCKDGRHINEPYRLMETPSSRLVRKNWWILAKMVVKLFRKIHTVLLESNLYLESNIWIIRKKWLILRKIFRLKG